MILDLSSSYFFFFFFNDTATTEIYTLSLHDALPISAPAASGGGGEHPCPASWAASTSRSTRRATAPTRPRSRRSEEHTSELQSRLHLVCRLLLEKKKTQEIDQQDVATLHLCAGHLF